MPSVQCVLPGGWRETQQQRANGQFRSVGTVVKATHSDEPQFTDISPLVTEQTLLDLSVWTELEARHQAAVDELTRGHVARAAQHTAHPVEDFLFTYYTLRPAQLRRWHPGAGTALLDAGDRSGWRFHRTVDTGPLGGAIPGTGPVPGTGATDTGRRTAVTADPVAFLRDRGDTVRFVDRLLATTQTAPPQFGCFGLHEWAMVYRAGDRRHTGYPLRLGPAGTDEVVEQHPIRCSHFDAFRFFTPEARPRNLLAPDRDSRDRMEQPGCLHASMDLYKWAYRLLPIITSSTLLDCFRLARDIRAVDMRASPYDFSELGYAPIPIETPAGKSEYVAQQRGFAARGQALRGRLRSELGAAFPQLRQDTGQAPVDEAATIAQG